ncbi:uncharacterized protein LOC143279812 [Babylonia areolata]|uniref:uncharacterized protein LOC143279812 n=1 Tax=Babylonia areolata TaxID=304850 RepID=UPI003FD0C460
MEAGIAGTALKVEMAPDHSWCWTHYSHLSLSDFGRAECLPHWKIAQEFEAAGFYSAQAGLAGMGSLRQEHIVYFTRCSHYNINPSVWTIPRGFIFPYKIGLQLAEVGRTSVTFSGQIINKLDGHTLARGFVKLVFLDARTGQPALVPEWYSTKYANVAQPQNGPFLFTRVGPEPPATAFCYRVEVAASDTDLHGHTNQNSYIRFCCDAAQAAVTAKALPGFHTDIARYPLTEQATMYIDQSTTGDRLHVHLWQCPQRQSKIFFIVKRQDSGSHENSSAVLEAFLVFGTAQTQLMPAARI